MDIFDIIGHHIFLLLLLIIIILYIIAYTGLAFIFLNSWAKY